MRERAIEGHPVPEGSLARLVLESWQRSRTAGLCSRRHAPPPLIELDELEALRALHPLRAAMPLIRSLLADVATDARHVVAVGDETGHLLWVDGSRGTQRTARDIGFVSGADWNEGSSGTNALGTALALGRPVEVFAGEHFFPEYSAWTGAAAPFRDPETGALIGAVDLTSSYHDSSSAMLPLARATARAVEAHLAADRAMRDAQALEAVHRLVHGHSGVSVLSPGGRVLGDGAGSRSVAVPAEPGELRVGGATVDAEPLDGAPGYWVLRQRNGHRPTAPAVTGNPDVRAPLVLRLLGRPSEPLVVGGHAIGVTPRQLEICALLALHEQGLGSGELRELLYGELDVADVTIRSELSRLRRVLGDALEARPYRFAPLVRTDVGHVERLLDEGRLRDAVRAYAGPLLPASQSPWIAARREQLHYELRAALLASSDPDALFEWIRNPAGARDAAVARLLTTLTDEDDARNAAAVAVVEADMFFV